MEEPIREILADENIEVEFLHEIGSRMAASDSLHAVLDRVVQFASTIVECDSCFVYVREGDYLVLRASKSPHSDVVDRLKLRLGQGIAGWVAEHRKPVAVPRNASKDPRFKAFRELPEDSYEALLSVPIICRGRVVGVINLQHQRPHTYRMREIQLISTAGFLVGGEIEMTRLEGEVAMLSNQLETRKAVERAKWILQRDLDLSEEEAYLTLQRQSRERGMSMKEMAQAIIHSDAVKRDRSGAKQ